MRQILQNVFQFVMTGIIISISIESSCQELYSKEECKNRNGLEYGGIGGIYIADNSNAQFYSGKPDNENNVDYIFKNHYWYEEIRHLLNFYDTVFVREYPEKMGYSPAFSFGLFVKYDLNCRTGIYLQFYYTKLKTNDVVSVEVDPVEFITEPDIRLLPIKGIEERNIIDLGISHSFGLNKIARLSVGGGISMNNTLVKESALYIEGKKYNLIQVYGNRPYVPNTNQQLFEIRQGGIGFGLYGNIGVRMEFNPTVAIEPGLSMHMMNVNLKQGSGLTSEFNFYVKILLKDLLKFN